jgi:putative tryptophan/tyrosine transport system substrate-binding protein
MTRRTVELFVTLALGLLVSLAVAAQPSTPVPRIGLLCLFSSAIGASMVESFRQGLRELGYIEGQNIRLESRWAEGHQERLAELAADLVRLDVAVLVTESTPATLAAKQATPTIPIVTAAVGNLVAAGLVASLARPGGNVTGVTTFASELSVKRLELLKEAAPQTTQVAVLLNAANPAHPRHLEEIQAAAHALGLQLQAVAVRTPPTSTGRSRPWRACSPAPSSRSRMACSLTTGRASSPSRPRAGSRPSFPIASSPRPAG